MDISSIADNYNNYIEKALQKRRFKYSDFNSVISKHHNEIIFKFLDGGESFEGRKINIIEFGQGKTTALIWSQMHGNEPVSTLALLDLMNILASSSSIAGLISQGLKLVIVPLLNPDGNERFDRRNAQGIDINRDAQSLISPEARLLTSLQERYKPEFGFNMHDMELYYISRPRMLQTAMALLAPECDTERTITPARKRSMQVISEVVRLTAPMAEGRIAKYNDSYMPDAFGDTFMRKGTSTILLESGSIADDTERAFARKLVCISLASALCTIAEGKYRRFGTELYNSLPDNIRYTSYDLKLTNLTIKSTQGDYTVDLGIRRIKPSHNPEDFTDDFSDFRIVNIGKLTNFGGIKNYDATGCCLSGKHSDIYMMRRADFEIVMPDQSIKNIKELL